MPLARGNKTSYKKKRTLIDIAQGQKVSVSSAADELKAAFPKTSIKCETLHAVLVALAHALGDDAFETAARALSGYGLTQGGIKSAVSSMLIKSGAVAERAAMLSMEQLVDGGFSARKAAEFAFATFDIDGQSQESILKRFRTAYKIHVAIKNGKSARSRPADGATGRGLIIQFRKLVEIEGVSRRVSMMPAGALVLGDGTFLVPDNREWRRMVNRGHATMYGVTEHFG
jgi:hypothetical protein